MRQVLKICCNHYVTAELVLKPLQTTNRAWTWTAQDFSGGELCQETLALKFRTCEQAHKFRAIFEQAQQNGAIFRMTVTSSVDAAAAADVKTIPQRRLLQVSRRSKQPRQQSRLVMAAYLGLPAESFEPPESRCLAEQKVLGVRLIAGLYDDGLFDHWIEPQKETPLDVIICGIKTYLRPIYRPEQKEQLIHWLLKNYTQYVLPKGTSITYEEYGTELKWIIDENAQRQLKKVANSEYVKKDQPASEYRVFMLLLWSGKLARRSDNEVMAPMEQVAPNAVIPSPLRSSREPVRCAVFGSSVGDGKTRFSSP